MQHYFFQLGFAPKLANLELSAYFSQHKIKYTRNVLSPHEIIISTKKELDHQHMINTLGGTIRIAPKIGSSDKPHLVDNISNILSQKSRKITFSITAVNFKTNILRSYQDIKEKLRREKISSRFIMPEKKFQNPLVIQDHKVSELILIQTNKGAVDIFRTLSISDPKSWIERDRSRPASDPKSGMMPPKVARMLVNISFKKPPTAETIFLDPFCGSGTLLAEAMTIGSSVFGVDISQRAISDSQQNLEWLEKNNQLSGKYGLLNSDIAKISASQLLQPISAVAFEGYLGPSKIVSTQELSQVVSDLGELYTQTFAKLAEILPTKTKVVAALPQHQSPESVKMLTDLIDTCENSRYTLLAGPVRYSKPGARVQRSIYILQTK